MPIIDIHTCIGVQPEDDRVHDAPTLLAEMDRAGVSAALCMHFAAIRYDTAMGNARLWEICQCYPRLHPVAVVNPSAHTGVLEEIRRGTEARRLWLSLRPGQAKLGRGQRSICAGLACPG